LARLIDKLVAAGTLRVHVRTVCHCIYQFANWEYYQSHEKISGPPAIQSPKMIGPPAIHSPNLDDPRHYFIDRICGRDYREQVSEQASENSMRITGEPVYFVLNKNKKTTTMCRRGVPDAYSGPDCAGSNSETTNGCIYDPDRGNSDSMLLQTDDDGDDDDTNIPEIIPRATPPTSDLGIAHTLAWGYADRMGIPTAEAHRIIPRWISAMSRLSNAAGWTWPRIAILLSRFRHPDAQIAGIRVRDLPGNLDEDIEDNIPLAKWIEWAADREQCAPDDEFLTLIGQSYLCDQKTRSERMRASNGE
jgi:hypothetical protein